MGARIPSLASPEAALLCAACRWPQDRRRSDDLAGAPIAWTRFLDLVRRHRTGPLVLRNLSWKPAPWPDSARDALRLHTQHATARTLRQIGALSKILEAFSRADIPVFVLKGAPLSVLLFGDPLLRESKDIDLLVAPESVDRAQAILRQSGARRHEPAFALRAHEERVYRRYRHQFCFLDDESGIEIELHWRLAESPHVLPMRFADLWQGRRHVALPGIDTAVLPETEMMLHLMLHGASHNWFRLKWIADIAAWMRQASSGAMEQVLSLARREKISRIAEQALRLAAIHLDAPLSDALRSAQPSHAVMRSTQFAARALAAKDFAEDCRRRLGTRIMSIAYPQALIAEPRSWADAIATFWINPSDWEIVRLPRVLFPLHLLLRPMIWLTKRIRRRLRAMRFRPRPSE